MTDSTSEKFEVHTDPKSLDRALLDRLVDPDAVNLKPLMFRPPAKLPGVEVMPGLVPEYTQSDIKASVNYMEFFPPALPAGPTVIPFGFGWAIVQDHHIVKLFRWKWRANRYLKNVC